MTAAMKTPGDLRLLAPARAAPPPAHRLPAWLPMVAAGAMFCAGLVLFWWPLRGLNLDAMNGLGLVSVLPVASLVGLVLVVASFPVLLARSRPATAVLSVMLVGVVACLNGVTAITEPLPRFATAYQILGYVNYVSHTGHVQPGVAAYFSWPGFFALIAFVRGAAGVHSLIPLLTWWPTVTDALLLVPFMMVTKGLRISWRARWLAALLLCVGNWVGQDYFSPQSFNFLLYLMFAAILVVWFGGQARARDATTRTPGERPAGNISPPVRAILLLLVILIFVASTLSHQLTPFLLIVACAGLVLVGRCWPRGLPVLLAVILVGWISYGTVTYWSGHLGTIFGNIGQLSGTFSASVSNRVTGSTTHQFADQSRIGLAVLMVVLALGGLVRRWRRGITDRVLLVLLIAPLTIAALQSYGGEIALRVYLFALPAIAVLTACLFFPGTDEPVPARAPATRPRAGGLGVSALAGRPARRSARQSARQSARWPGRWSARRPGRWSARWPGSWSARWSARWAVAGTLALASVVVAGLSLLFVVARYGNEAFERTPPSEYAAMNYIYDHAGRGTSVLWISRPAGSAATPELPWEFRDIGSVSFVAQQAPARPDNVAAVAARLRGLGRGAFLITSRTTSLYISQTVGYPASWGGRFATALSADPALRLVYSGRDVAVYQASQPVGAAPVGAARVGAAPVGTAPVGAAPVSTARSRSTIWSPIGLAALIAAMVLLGAREFIRLCVPSRGWLLEPLAIASLPVLALLLYAVAERFAVLS